ncbi:hypothetical protein D3C78_893340 [compost metagenome]
MVDRRARQRLRLAPLTGTAQPAVGEEAVQLAGVVQPALAQVLPGALGVRGADVAQAGQLRVGTVVAGHQDQRGAGLGQLDQPLDAVAPVAHPAVQRHQDQPRVAQHVLDVEVDRGVVAQLAGVGQAQARVVAVQLAGGLGQQRQVGVAAAEDDQLGRGLRQVGDAIVRNESARLGAQ